MTKWLLIWVVGGTVTGASLPEAQKYDTQEKCNVAAEAINKLGKGGIANSSPTIVSATCIEVPAED